MRLSELTTDQAAEVLVRLAKPIANILQDEQFTGSITKKINTDGLSRAGLIAAALDRAADMVPFLLRDHKTDVFQILAVLNDKTAQEIGAQNIICTMRQARELLRDKELLDFFRSSATEAQMA